MKSLQYILALSGLCLIFSTAALAEEPAKVLGNDVTQSAPASGMPMGNGTMHGQMPGMMPMANGSMPGPMPGMMPMDNGTMMPGMMMPMGGVPGCSTGNSSMQGMESYGRMAYSDKSFLSAMIPHHEAAVAMAKEVLQKGKNPRVKAWAEAVIKGQEAEITLMRGLLQKMGGEDENSANMMRGAMHAMTAGAAGENADRDFVCMMIPHHAGALHMATRALVHSDNQQILTLAKQIIDAQAREILEYKEWLEKESK